MRLPVRDAAADDTSSDSSAYVTEPGRIDVVYPGLLRPANADAPWDDFAPASYCDHNYATVRDEDREIVELVRDFFAGTGVREARGIDVGAGPNLYPSLGMLPFCRRVELVEYSASNVTWLREQVRHCDARWGAFWDIYRVNPAYAAVGDLDAARMALSSTASVSHGSIFTLPRRTWGMGTMFFVACSLSARRDEFSQAVDGFIGALVPDAPFAAAFMEGSVGYEVDGIRFPAVGIGETEIKQSLASMAYDVTTTRIDAGATPFRSGYTGMYLATGRAAG